MPKLPLLPCLLVALMSLQCILYAEVTLYISPSGNDAWSGGLPEVNAGGSDGPLATLDAARLKVRELRAKDASEPITVFIREGEYALTETVVFGVEDSGTEAAPITYQAYEGETPIFTGGKVLDAWSPLKEEVPGISDAAKGKLFYHEIPSDLKDTWNIKSLYLGDQLLKRSRSEEFKTANDAPAEDFNYQPKRVASKVKPDDEPIPFSRELYFSGDDLRDWSNPRDIEIVTEPLHQWLINILPLAKIDFANKVATLAIDPTYYFSPSNPYFVENALEYLDAPGEWCYRSDEGRVYWWPEVDASDASIVAPYLQEFILVEGVEDVEPAKHIHFKGLNFRHGMRDTWVVEDKGLQHDWEMYDKGNALVRFRHAEHCSISDSKLTQSSGSGIRLDLYCQNITVESNELAHLGGSGIVLSGYGPGTKDENHHNIVHDNYIHHVGLLYKHSLGIFIAQSGHNEITHNTIHDMSYSGMVISGCRHDEIFLHKPLGHRREWISSVRVEEALPYIEKAKKMRDMDQLEPLLHARENLIAHNEIYRVMQRLGDGNPIYLSAQGNNNRLEGNFLHESEEDRGGIRLDDESRFTIIRGNVMKDLRWAFRFKGPGIFEHNFSIGNFATLGGSPGHHNTVSGVKNVFYDSYTKPNRKTTDFYDVLTPFQSSLFFDPDGDYTGEVGTELIPEERRDGAEVGLRYQDPMFDKAAFEQKIFRFLPGSPAEELGIKPIDLSQVGSSLAP